MNLFLLFTSCPEAWNKTPYPPALENGSRWHDPTSLGIVICKGTHWVQHWKQKFWNHVRESFLLKVTSTFSEMPSIPFYWQKGITGHWSMVKSNWWSEWLSRSQLWYHITNVMTEYFFSFFVCLLSYIWKVCKTISVQDWSKTFWLGRLPGSFGLILNHLIVFFPWWIWI